MDVYRRLNTDGVSFALTIKASFDAHEMAIIDRFRFRRFRIKTSDGPFVGRDALPINVKSAYRSILGKIKNRWSTALVRTTSFILLDVILLFASAVLKLIQGLFKLVFGRRKTLATAMQGITIRSSRIEKIKEAEFFIFVSLAAVAKAIDYAQSTGAERVYEGVDFILGIEGLDFAGAGTQVEDDFAGANAMVDRLKAA